MPAAAVALDWERWPPQVEAVIAGHLADLPDEDRALLQAAAVQGEQFAAEVAARVLGWGGEEAAVRRLSGPLRTRHRLVEAVSLDRLPSSGQRLSRYRFRHALLQRSAYGSLDAVARAWLHEATGRALEAIYGPAAGHPPAGQAEGEQPQALAPELARHYEAAGLPLEATRYRLEAGRWAARLVAYELTLHPHIVRVTEIREDQEHESRRPEEASGIHTPPVRPVCTGWHAGSITIGFPVSRTSAGFEPPASECRASTRLTLRCKRAGGVGVAQRSEQPPAKGEKPPQGLGWG
ncbi:MAG: hypothetical protein ISS56_19760 [Anaerolineae bacterium]|nr:hypothetical protein [Anaerolineae bacterium]